MNVKEIVYIIIPVHNRKEITLNCLKALKEIKDLQRYHVLIIDDGSTDGTGAAIQALYPEIKILTGDGNLWWTGAIALGMQYAYEQGAEYLIWLNDDCLLPSSAIANLVSFCQEHEDAIIGGQGVEAENQSAIVFGGKRKTWQGYRFIHPPEQTVTPCDLLSGNLVCIPRAVIDQIGYPDAQAMPHYGGDSLYLILAQKAGFKIFVDSSSVVLSVHGESKLYPQQWLLGKGEPLDILKLVFVPQSGLSWRVWLRLNWEAYAFWGIVMFFKKYLSILLITILRFLPLEVRYKLFVSK